MNTTPVGNEAELQASLVARIRAALPLLPANIRLERFLNLRVGRQAFKIDGTAIEPGLLRGRYDVLVLIEDAPLLLVELKDTDEELTEDDVRQGMSYAALHRPFVPMVLATNGKKHILRQTFDGKDLDPSVVGAEQLKDALKAASAVAAAAVEQAVRALLGASGKTWRHLISAWTDAMVASLSGDVHEFARPIPREFSIPRGVVKEIEARLAAGARVVVLHGPPLSGVTNALAQYARADQVGTTLLLDEKGVPDVLQFMANRLTREVSFPVSKDDLRGWLNARRGLLDLRLAIDGLPREGLEELVEFANAGLIRLVFGLDSAAFQKIAAVEGRREHSTIGRSAESVELHPLSDEEFFAACELLERSFGAGLYVGAQHVPDLRHPRKLRVLVAMLPPGHAGTAGARETMNMLLPIPGPQDLRAFSRVLVQDSQLRFGLQKLAAAFLADAEQHVNDPAWVVATWGKPTVDPGRLEADLGQARIDRLVGLGLLSWVDVPGVGPRVLVRVEELLADYVADIWAAGLAKAKDNASLVSEVERLLRLTFVVPSGEVALALAIYLAAQRGANNVLGTVVPFLLIRKPKQSTFSAGSRVSLLVKDFRISLEFGEGTEEKAIGGLEAWVVLSHLASWNMAADGYNGTVNFSIVRELGSAPHLIFYPRPIEPDFAPGFHFHDFEGVGSVLCLSTGIVEPLVQAMMNHASEFPEEFILLAKLAIEEREFHLAWRLLTVASILRSSV